MMNANAVVSCIWIDDEFILCQRLKCAHTVYVDRRRPACAIPSTRHLMQHFGPHAPPTNQQTHIRHVTVPGTVYASEQGTGLIIAGCALYGAAASAQQSQVASTTNGSNSGF